MSKTKVTSQEMAQGLWMFCRKFSKGFYKDFKPRVEKLGIKLDTNSEITFSREIIMINLWIISKALSPDKKALDALHKIYLFGHSNLATTEEEKIEFPKQAEKELHKRYRKYYDAWDDNSRGNQSILAITMLEYMFNQGKPDKRFVNFMLIAEITGHILGMMKAVLDFRKDFEITD